MTGSHSREALIDETFTLRNLLDREKRDHEQTRRELAVTQHTMVKDNRRYQEEVENLQRELAQATARIEDLEAQLDSHREQEEEPYV